MEPPAVLTKITDTVPKNNARKQFCTDPCLQPVNAAYHSITCRAALCGQHSTALCLRPCGGAACPVLVCVLSVRK
eukprot:1160114-Pelagomonas_calceolata.AAC.14